MRNARRGFTLIELLTVITIIGILATLGIPRLQAVKLKAVRASMVSDLRNLVVAEEAFFAGYGDYAGRFGPGSEVAGPGARGALSFQLSPGNALKLSRKNPKSARGPGWSATITNPAVAKTTLKTCGVFVGAIQYSPNKAVVAEGAPTCY